MKKIICFISVIFLLVGCASTPEMKAPVDDSLAKLHKAKEIQCSFTKAVSIELTEQGELEIEQSTEYDDFGLRLLLKVDPKSDNATIIYFEDINDLEDEENQIAFNSKVQRWEESISFILDVEGWFIATIVVFNAEDKFSDYGAKLAWFYEGPYISNSWGSCKINPQYMKKSTKLKDVSFTIKSVNTYSPLKEPWGEYKVIVETSTLPHEALLREIALEIWRTEGADFHEFNIEFYLLEMDTDEIPYAESVVGPEGVSSFDFSE